jgi:NADPH:quinone reductase-like Zn-dependent oxidoreductase
MIHAVVVDPALPERLTVREVEAPVPASNEALVRGAAISLNRGEVRGAMMSEAGARPGWDLAGTVERAAADGSGPREGTRVVGLKPSGAWAEVVAVPTNTLAELPADVSFAQAATLPVAGLTALLALGKGGNLIERDVLVTGASGGVGLFAVELARLAGTRVVGAVHQQQHAAVVAERGAYEVVYGERLEPARAFGPYHLILDSVGGASLGTALTLLANQGTCVFFGVSGGAEVTFDAGTFFRTGGTTLYGLFLFDEVTRGETASLGLTRLSRLVADDKLHPLIEVEAPWTEIGAVAQRYFSRGFPGKAVLHIA